MKKISVLALLLLIAQYAIAQFPPIAWANKIEGIDVLSPQCAVDVNAIDTLGNIYCSGYFRDSLRPDQNQISNYLVGNSVYDCGVFMKYDKDGLLIWAKSILSHVGNFYINDLAIDLANNIYIFGQGIYTDTIDFDPGPSVANQISDGNDFFIAKYDPNGNYVWSKLINVINGNSTPSNRANKIRVDHNQNIFIGGRFQNQIDLDPSATSLIVTNPGGVNCNCTVGFYAKYDNTGNVIWGYADTDNGGINDIDVNEVNGQILLGGDPKSTGGKPLKLCGSDGLSTNFLSSSKIFVQAVKFDQNGSFYFSGHFNSSGNDFNWGPGTYTMTTAASYILSGFVGKYSNTGSFLWAQEYDPTQFPANNAYTYRINVDHENNPILAFSEENGSYFSKGFVKLNPLNGFTVWNFSYFDVSVGLNKVNVVISPFDNTFVFGAGVGFSGNSVLTIDADPDPTFTENLTGKGWWSMMAKYGNCSSAPSTPGAISGLTSLCNTDSVTYSIAPISGVSSYTWTLPVGWSGASDSNSITVLPSASSGNVEVAANNLCGTSTSSFVLVNYTGTPVVNAISNVSQICAGDSVILTGNGASSYIWNNGVLNGVAFAPAGTNTYVVTGNLNGCEGSDSVTVIVNPLPIVDLNLSAIDTVCQDDGLIALIGGTPAGGVYSGFGVTSNSFDALSSGMGIYSIVYEFIDTNNCSGSAFDSIYVDVCTGHATLTKLNEFSIFPNPAHCQFSIQTNEMNNEIWVTDLLGKLVFGKLYNQTSVNLEITQSGVYLVYMKTEKGITQKKLIIH